MTVKPTLQLGDPKLKAENNEVKNLKSPKVKKVIKDLKDTLLSSTLIGIAAPQIGHNYKIFLTMPRKTKFRNLPFEDKLRVYINPKITKSSKEQIIIWEGCGCVGITDMFFGPVKRPREITVVALDEKGQKFQIRCDGILARVIQHEVDHLNGIEFIEKVDDYKKIMHQTHYTKKVRNSPEQDKAAKVSILEMKEL